MKGTLVGSTPVDAPFATRWTENVERTKKNPKRCLQCNAKIASDRLEEDYCQLHAPEARMISHRYCAQGHDTYEVGRDKVGRCMTCRRRQIAQSNQKARAALKAKYNGHEYLHGLKAAKEKTSLTWPQLADKTDIPTNSLKQHAYLAHRASPEATRKLARVLGVTVKKLKGRKR